MNKFRLKNEPKVCFSKKSGNFATVKYLTLLIIMLASNNYLKAQIPQQVRVSKIYADVIEERDCQKILPYGDAQIILSSKEVSRPTLASAFYYVPTAHLHTSENPYIIDEIILRVELTRNYIVKDFVIEGDSLYFCGFRYYNLREIEDYGFEIQSGTEGFIGYCKISDLFSPNGTNIKISRIPTTISLDKLKYHIIDRVGNDIRRITCIGTNWYGHIPAITLPEQPPQFTPVDTFSCVVNYDIQENSVPQPLHTNIVTQTNYFQIYNGEYNWKKEKFQDFIFHGDYFLGITSLQYGMNDPTHYSSDGTLISTMLVFRTVWKNNMSYQNTNFWDIFFREFQGNWWWYSNCGIFNVKLQYIGEFNGNSSFSQIIMGFNHYLQKVTTLHHEYASVLNKMLYTGDMSCVFSTWPYIGPKNCRILDFDFVHDRKLLLLNEEDPATTPPYYYLDNNYPKLDAVIEVDGFYHQYVGTYPTPTQPVLQYAAPMYHSYYINPSLNSIIKWDDGFKAIGYHNEIGYRSNYRLHYLDFDPAQYVAARCPVKTETTIKEEYYYPFTYLPVFDTNSIYQQNSVLKCRDLSLIANVGFLPTPPLVMVEGMRVVPDYVNKEVDECNNKKEK